MSTRVYFDIGFESFGLSRVIMQLHKYLPAGFEVAGDFESADLTVLHVVGRHDHMVKQAQRIKARGAKYAVIQYVLQSCRNPDPNDWTDFWSGAQVVWSYYDLRKYMHNFYHAPLAADPDVFYPQDEEKKYIIGTNGNTYQAECIGETQLAAWQANGRAVHVGELFSNNPIVDYFSRINDDELRKIYNQCMRFSCLRRKDGFELPAIEALLCGVRPIMFDTYNYRQWFDGLADFIPETSVAETVDLLKKILKKELSPVTDAEIAKTKTRFNWEQIIRGFWEQCA